MDSSSFELTLKPSKIYVPKSWSNFLDHLSKIHDLPERLVVVKNVKVHLEEEAARLAASRSEPFTMSMEFLKDAIKSLEEEEEAIMKDMKKFQKPITYTNMSQDTEDAEEGTLQGRRFASGSDHKKKANGISALVEGCRDEGNSSGNFSSLYGQHLQKTQIAPYQHDGCVMSDIIVSPLPPLASGDKDTLPNDPYIRITEMLSRRAESSTSSGATLFGTNSFDPERHQTTEVMRNLYKRKRASEEPSQAPFFPSFGRLGSSDRHDQVPLYFGLSDAMSTRAVSQVVSDNGKRVMENLQQPSSQSMFTRPLPRLNLDKGKQVIEYPSIHLKMDQQGQLSIAGLRLDPAPTPPAPATATAIATAALDRGKQGLEEPIQASGLVSRRAQTISKGQFPPSLLNQINRSSGL